jgi:DNA (cytosine-5)-methyltransferase 1
LWYIDKTFTIASTQDQFIATNTILERTIKPMTPQPTTPQVPLRFLSVCSGMEAASVAWEPLGWKAVGFSEIEPFPCAVLAHRFPNTTNYGSLTEYQSWPLQPGSIDLLVGGTPCQSFSVAGLRKGLADPRGNLALVFLGLADKLKPRWIVWENVPGVLSSDGGRDFGSFLGALEQLGYGWAYRVLDAQYFGVPQRRRRVFVVASLGGRDVAASVLLKPESVCWHPAPRRKKGQATAADAGAGVEAGSPIAFRKSKRACSKTDNERGVLADASNTLNNFDLGDTRTTHAVVEPIPIQDGREIEKRQNGLGIANQGDPAYTIDTTGAQAIAIQGTIIGGGENAGPQGTGATEGGPMFTLTKTDIHGVCHHMPGSVAPTVTSSGPPYSRTGNERVEAEALAITFQPGNLRREAGAEPSTVATTTLKASMGDQMPHVCHPAAGFKWHQGAQAGSIGYVEGQCPTLTTVKEPAVIHPTVPLDGMNLLSRLGPCGENHSIQNFTPGDPMFTLKKGGDQHGVLTPMAVRRLTPMECERLQGFPDNWSQIPWKGKPADQCPDGPRYKCAGNSMAVPVMRWIGEQIARVELSLNNPTK